MDVPQAEKTHATSSHVEKSHLPQAAHLEITDNEAVDGDFKLTLGKLVAIISFVLGYFSDTIVIVMASAVLTNINRSVGPSPGYTWIITSLTVGGAACAPVVGRMGDIFGRRYYLLAGNTIAIIGTAMAANARSFPLLVTGGALIGVASSMRQLAWACLGEIVPKRSRGLAFSFLQAALSLAQAFGPVIAYAFIQHGSWRPVYWLPFALDFTALILVFFFYHPIDQYIHEEGKTKWDQFLALDWLGLSLFIAGMVIFLIGISFGGNQFPWRSAGTIAPIVIGAALLVACGLYEAYVPLKYPIFPPIIFKNVRGYTMLLVATVLVGMLYYATVVLWPTQVQTLYADTPQTIGWYSAAPGIGGLVFGLCWGPSMRYLGHARWQLLLATVLMTIFSACMATSTPRSHVSSTILVIFDFGCISGASLISVAMAQVAVSHAYIGVASGVVVTARSFGGAVATTIYLSILQNKLKSSLATDVAVPLAKNGVSLSLIPEVILALTSGDVSSPALSQISPAALLAGVAGLKEAYAGSFRLIYLVSLAFGILGCIAVAFVADCDHLMTRTIDIALDEGAHIHAKMDTGHGHILRNVETSELEKRKSLQLEQPQTV